MFLNALAIYRCCWKLVTYKTKE